MLIYSSLTTPCTQAPTLTVSPQYPQCLHTCGLINGPHKINRKQSRQRGMLMGGAYSTSIHKNKQYFNQLLFLSICKQQHTEKVNLLPCSCCKTTRTELFSITKENKFLKSPAENPSPTQKVGWSKPEYKIPSHAKGSRPLYNGHSCSVRPGARKQQRVWNQHRISRQC